MSNLVDYARDELTRAGYFEADGDYGGMLGDAVVKLVEMFSDQGHSGFSAGMALAAFKKVAAFEPLTPLTGDDDEWSEPFDAEGTRQNKRCAHVFKRADGTAYDSEGIVFEDADGCRFTSGDSRVDVIFPYMPTSEIRPAAA